MTIKHDEMVRGLKKPGAAILETLTAEKVDAWHMASCIPGEAAELFDGVIKNDRVNVREELGDIEFYVEGLRQSFEIDRNETIDAFVAGEANDLCGRAGDVFDTVKKFVIYNKPFDREALVKAFGAFEGVLANIRERMDISHEDSLLGNIEKLGKRYEGLQYTDAAAQARADKA